MLEDFIRAAEDKLFVLHDLFGKYEKLENFLKHNEPFMQQCMDLKQKANFIIDNLDSLQTFLQQIEQIKQKENFLGFEPIVDAHSKLQELKQIKLVHTQQLLESQDSAIEVEEILAAYNDLVERISNHMQVLNAGV